MWIARNKNNELMLFVYSKPWRAEDNHWFAGSLDGISVGFLSERFKDLTWESEPIEVEVVSKNFMDQWREGTLRFLGD